MCGLALTQPLGEPRAPGSPDGLSIHGTFATATASGQESPPQCHKANSCGLVNSGSCRTRQHSGCSARHYLGYSAHTLVPPGASQAKPQPSQLPLPSSGPATLKNDAKGLVFPAPIRQSVLSFSPPPRGAMGRTDVGKNRCGGAHSWHSLSVTYHGQAHAGLIHPPTHDGGTVEVTQRGRDRCTEGQWQAPDHTARDQQNQDAPGCICNLHAEFQRGPSSSNQDSESWAMRS